MYTKHLKNYREAKDAFPEFFNDLKTINVLTTGNHVMRNVLVNIEPEDKGIIRGYMLKGYPGDDIYFGCFIKKGGLNVERTVVPISAGTLKKFFEEDMNRMKSTIDDLHPLAIFVSSFQDRPVFVVETTTEKFNLYHICDVEEIATTIVEELLAASKEPLKTHQVRVTTYRRKDDIILIEKRDILPKVSYKLSPLKD